MRRWVLKELDRPENTQPNVHDYEIPGRLWIAIIATGVAAGLTGGMLMKLLRGVQQAAFHYASGEFLGGVAGVSDARRVMVMTLAGLLAGVTLSAIRKLR